MGCKAGYPDKPCPFPFNGGVFAGRVTRASCGACINFIPPPHILAWCMLYDREQVVCKLPKKACEGCKEKHVHGPGVLSVDGKVDWQDPESVKAYWRERSKLYPDERAAAMVRFLEKDPDYFTRYRENNREAMRAASKRHYDKKKRERNELSASEVRRDPHGPREQRDEDLPASGPDGDVRSGDA